MKRTDRLTNIIALLLFLAFLAYAAVFAVRSLGGATVTAEAVAADIELSATASGIVIREETVLRSDRKFIDVTVSEGEKVAAGSAVATAMRSEQGLDRAARIHELEREISRVSAALREMRSAEELTTREAYLNSAARQLASAVARHETASMDAASLNLEALLLNTYGETVSAGTLDALERELTGLRNQSGGDSQQLYAEKPGVFSSVVDGYEGYGYADLQNLTPSGLQKLIDNGGSVPSGAYGKLVNDYRWYFAAVMSVVDAAKLTPGERATLSFGRWYSANIEGRVMSVSASEDGNVVVVFRCDTALTDTLAMREVSAKVVFGNFSGVRVPAAAIRTDEDTEKTYVWAVTAMRLERKNVEIIYAMDDYVVVSRGTNPGALREGNTIVISGKDLKEGKILE